MPSTPRSDDGGQGSEGSQGGEGGGESRETAASDGFDDTALSLVVNALADLQAERAERAEPANLQTEPAEFAESGTLADAASVDAVREAYRAATDAETRASFEAALAARFEDVSADGPDRVDDSDGPADAGDGDLLAVVRSVAAELDDRGATFAVRHDVPVSFSALAVGLNRFARTRDPDALLSLGVSPAVERRFAAATEPLREGRYDAAAWALVDAVGAGSTHEDAVASRVAAGWARHWAGDHAAALDLVEETLHLDTAAWPAQQLALAVRHDSPEFFRDDRLAAAVYLRARVTEPDGPTVTASLGTGANAAAGETWEALPGPLTAVPIESLPEDGTLRFELTGTSRAMPTLRTYYLALGVVEPNSHRARSTDQILLDGPHPAAVETLRVESPGE